MTVQTGIGYDCHPFVEGQRLVLGGVEIARDRGLGLIGHSDADVLSHPITDALLGACALADIGQHFPDIDSALPRRRFAGAAGGGRPPPRDHGYAVLHVGATVKVERPRIDPVRERIREAMAGAIGIDREHASIKATRGEGMGFIGREEGAAALAVATVERVET